MAWTPAALATTASFPNFEDVAPLTLSGSAKQVETGCDVGGERASLLALPAAGALLLALRARRRAPR